MKYEYMMHLYIIENLNAYRSMYKIQGDPSKWVR